MFGILQDDLRALRGIGFACFALFCIPLHFQGVSSLEHICKWIIKQHGIVSQTAV